jgi:preprotein translocase subunit SecY
MLYVSWMMAGLMLLLWVAGVASAVPVGNSVHLLLLAAMMAVATTLVARPRTV